VATESHLSEESAEGSAAARLAISISTQHAELLAQLRRELGSDGEAFAEAAQRLALDFGAVTATAVGAAPANWKPDPAASDRALRSLERTEAPPTLEPADAPPSPATELEDTEPEEAEAPHELPSLHRPGHMRRRLDQLVETNRRYGHPFGLAVFDASGPATRDGAEGGGQEMVLAIVGAALRDSIRIVDEAFRLEEDAICVLAPNLRTVEGVQMAERLLGQLEELERAGGLPITVTAGVAACPDHGADAAELLRKADAAMWRARAVGQPVGVGALQDP
jgi:diguanylate cyclase (GGDEF)-like protein